jgi:hypothetical protein
MSQAGLLSMGMSHLPGSVSPQKPWAQLSPGKSQSLIYDWDEKGTVVTV